MNNRKRKKHYKKDIVEKFYSLHSQKGDIIVLEYERNKHPFKELLEMYKCIKRVISKTHNLIILPDTASLKIMNQKELINVRDVINTLIDNEGGDSP